MPLQITMSNVKEITASDRPVVIDIYADWCGPCQQMAPVFHELEKEMPDIKFVKINVDEARELAIQYGVTSIPTFIFMKHNEVVGRSTGYMAKDDLAERITELLS